MKFNFICDLYNLLVSRDNWSDFIWPALITIVTIMASVWLAREEFRKTQRAEKRKIDSENRELRDFILRNIKRVIDQLSIDEDRFRRSYIDNYTIETGIAPISMLFSFKELEILNAIDVIRSENVFREDLETEKEFNELYLTFSAISIIWDSYNKISDEVLKINSFIKDYDTVLLDKYQNVISFIERRMIEYVKENRGDESSNCKELLNRLNNYKSEINNFSELNAIIGGLDESEFFNRIVEQHFFEFSERKSQFLIYYLKYRQEVLLFHDRINYLIKRIEKNRIDLQEFYSRFKTKVLPSSPK